MHAVRTRDQFCGVRAEVAREAARIVEPVQWCSAEFLARELGMDTVASRRLLKALEDDGRLVRYEGMLPPGHDGAWLPEEEAGGELLVLWHLTYPEGKALAKARIGHAVPRAQAEELLTQVLDRVRAVNGDPAGSHIIECATLFGSLTDPARHEVGDVDLIVYARRRNRGTGPYQAYGAQDVPGTAAEGMQLSDEKAAGLRMSLEVFLRPGDERLDVSVVDESSDDPRPVPAGAVEREVFRPEPADPRLNAIERSLTPAQHPAPVDTCVPRGYSRRLRAPVAASLPRLHCDAKPLMRTRLTRP